MHTRIVLTALYCLLTASLSQASIVQVLEDASPLFSNPDSTEFNDDGFLYVGDLATQHTVQDIGRNYLKFQLPALVPGTQITSAILRGVHAERFNGADDFNPFDWYLALNDSWSDATITWNNQPGTSGSPIASWDPTGASVNSVHSWDITSAVNGEYQGDGVISLVFRSRTEGSSDNWNYWWSRDNLDGVTPFEIEYTIAAISNGAIPEVTSFLIWGLLGLSFAAGGWKRREQRK